MGYALFFHTYSTFLGQPSLYLEDLFVLPSQRGRGLGKALLARLARLAVERGCGRFEWMVLDWNTPAIQFYESLGAARVARVEAVPDDGRGAAALRRDGLVSPEPMLVSVDVDYRPDATVAACVLFRDWGDAAEAAHFVDRGPPAEAYVPGEFYRRELPALLRVLARCLDPLTTVIIDGYVWLGGDERPGPGRAPVRGARAKRARHRRGEDVVSLQPGRGAGAARRQPAAPAGHRSGGGRPGRRPRCIQRMHGPSRLPTLLKRVDRLCREA